MRIAIVDDDEKFLAQVRQTLAPALADRGVRAQVVQFTSAEALLAAHKTFDIYLLDVLMPGTDGIALGRRIRKDQPKAPILFFTTSRDFAVEAFGIAASDYVVKPFTTDAFTRALDRALERLSSTSQPMLTFRLAEGVVSVPRTDIVSVETGGHYLTVGLVGGRVHVVRQPLQDLWEKIEGDATFLRVGRQAIVNLARVTDFDGSTLSLAGGRRISVPRRLRTEVKAAYLDFYSA